MTKTVLECRPPTCQQHLGSKVVLHVDVVLMIMYNLLEERAPFKLCQLDAHVAYQRIRGTFRTHLGMGHPEKTCLQAHA